MTVASSHCVTVRAVAAPDDDPQDFYDEIKDLQRELLMLLPEHIHDLRSALALAITDQGARATVQRLGHRLNGTAATVRLEAIGDVGRAIERFCHGRARWTAADVARVQGAVDALDAWSHEALEAGTVDQTALTQDPRVKALAEAS